MEVQYYNSEKGIISEIFANGVRVPFYEGKGPMLYYKTNDERTDIELSEKNGKYIGFALGAEFETEHIISKDTLTLKVRITNKGDTKIFPDAIGISLGINSYMSEYPQWNDKFFPSFLRCEKTHFTGYFMSPLGNIVAVTCDSPIAAWELDYNIVYDENTGEQYFGHRIYTGNLLFTLNENLPSRYPDNLKGIAPGETLMRSISITPLDDVDKFRDTVYKRFSLPMLDFERYSLAKGETARLKVFTNENYRIEVIAPSGKMSDKEEFVVSEYGVYTARVITESGKISEGMVHCRHDYGYYLKAARKNAIYRPQKATTHTESWYGHFSSFLAKKHYPDETLDTLAKKNFDEIMPYMFDFENGKPILCPQRVQNTACLLSLLTDLYESDKEHNEIYLDYANNMAQDLIDRQTPDGAYRSGNTHYTSVIYIAKSMLELALCEKELAKNDTKYEERYKKHYESAKAAVLDLVKLLEKIGTEGEHTLEDGMINCSILQIAYYALTLEEEEREPFIKAAEYLVKIHKCLEELITPDCRTRGATLRFWEAQYDVMIRGNMMNTPHGWTSWKTYGTYYLYLLTGKEKYLKDTVDTMGACIQMVDEEENLRWAFIKDPYTRYKVMIPDCEAPFKDGYESIPKEIEKGYRGKYKIKTVTEGYIDLISGWYRGGEQKPTGGYDMCPLIYEDRMEMTDCQGGACDNDVHEHFKCLEETLLKKVFVICKDGLRGYNCSVRDGEIIEIEPYGECEYVHINSEKNLTIKINSREIKVGKGLHMLKL